MNYNHYGERAESWREFRYVLMRSIRILFYAMIAAGVVATLFGVVWTLMGIPSVLMTVLMGATHDIETGLDRWGSLLLLGKGLLAFFGGLTLLSIGASTVNAYWLDSYMPTTFIRRCPKCGEPLAKESLNFFCPGKSCHTFLPLGVTVVCIRLVSKMITAWNITYVVLAIGFALL